MSNPNKAARGSGQTPQSRASASKRQGSSEMTIDMGRFSAGEMTAEEFRRKWDPAYGGGK